MGDELHGIEEDVRFNWDGAASLERELRSTANTLDSQIPRRNGYASDAREEWRGVYSREFQGRMRICTSDAGRLSSAMELAANQVQRARGGRAARAGPSREGARVEARAGQRRLHGQGGRLPVRRGRQAADPAAGAAAQVRLDRAPGARKAIGDGHQFRTAGRSRSLRVPQPQRRRRAARPQPAPAQHVRRLPVRDRVGRARHPLDAGRLRHVHRVQRDRRAVGRAKIADAFRRAGGDGSVKTLPDAAIHASLRAAGLLGGRQSVTFDDPVAYGMPPTTGYANDPVNTASGNFVELEDDLPFAGLTAGLTFARMYNSRSDRSGAFGTGWSSWADARLNPRQDGAEYVGPDGQRALFPRMGDGLRARAGRRRARRAGAVRARPELVRRRAVGVRRGRPARARDQGPGHRRATSRTRTGAWPSCATRAARPCACTGASDRIEALECSDGRSVAYRYDDGELVEAGGARHYEVGEGKVLSVTDADGVVEVANAYDEQGRVLRQLSPFGRNTVFGYLPGQVTVASDENDGPTNVFIHDAAGRLLSLIVGDETRVSFAYDSWGNPVAVTDRKGAVTVQEWDERENLKRRVLPTGVEFTFTHDDADRVLEVAASTGASFQHRYDGDERSPAELIDAEGGVTRLTVAGRARARDRRSRRRAPALRLRRRRQPRRRDRRRRQRRAARARRRGRRGRRDLAARAPDDLRPRRPRPRRSSATSPGGAVWRYEYSPAGRLTAVDRPVGRPRGDPLRRARRGRGDRRSARPHHHARLRLPRQPHDGRGARRRDVALRLRRAVPGDAHRRPDRRDVAARVRRRRQPDRRRSIRSARATRPRTTTPTASRRCTTGITSASFDFDALGRCLAQMRPDGTSARAVYDRLGRRTSIEDPVGGTSTLEYTPARARAPDRRAVRARHDVRVRPLRAARGADRRRRAAAGSSATTPTARWSSPSRPGGETRAARLRRRGPARRVVLARPGPDALRLRRARPRHRGHRPRVGHAPLRLRRRRPARRRHRRQRRHHALPLRRRAAG